MKRTVLAIMALGILFAGLATAQTPDEEYLAAMQISDNCQKVKALEAYITKYGGQGTANEHWAHAYYCLTPCATKNNQKAAESGEKALSMSGIDGQTRLALLATIPSLYEAAGQMDKAKAAAQKLIDFGKSQSDAKLGAQLQAGGYELIGRFAEKSGDYGGAAQDLFVGQDKDLAASYGKIEEHNKAIEEFTKTYNSKIEGKTEDDLSAADKRLLQTLEANIEAEKQAIERIQAGQKGVLDKFNALVAQVRQRLGK